MSNNGYVFFLKDNLPYAVSKSTGEIVDAINTVIPVGSIVYTPEQQEEYRERKEQERLRALRREQGNELGYFYFLSREHQLGNISAETVGRLIYLLTYLDYDGNLMLSQRTHLQKSDLESVMGFSKWTVNRFLKEITPSYITESKDGLKLTNADVVRGRLNKTDKVYQKMYINTIRKIYKSVKPSNHKHLGYIFQTIPYINLEYNILCTNPNEVELEKIEPITIGDFCKMIGFDVSNFHRLKKIYNSITFEINGQEQYFLSFVSNENNADTIRMFVNPRVLYSGSDYKKVEVLGLFTKKK